MKKRLTAVRKYYGKNLSFIVIGVAIISCVIIIGLLTTRKITMFKFFTSDNSLNMGKYLILGVLCAVVYIVAMVWYILLKISNKRSLVLTVSLCVMGAIVARFCLMDFISYDYNIYLSKWVETMRPMSLKAAVTTPIGDYNMPYMYLIFIISKINFPQLYLIKLVSIVFDIVLAVSIMKLVSLKTESPEILSLAYVCGFFIPTVFMNSSMWSQCDVIYTAFCFLGLYYALKNKGLLSSILFGLAFSFKIQTIFILPVVIVLVVANKIKIKQLIGFIAAFVATLIPPIILGRQFKDTIGIYFTQVSEYPHLALNTHSFYTLISDEHYFDALNMVAIILAAVGCCVMLYISIENYKKLKLCDFVTLAFIFTALIPFLLPRMHDRYFYMCDVLSLVFAFYNRRRWYVPLIMIGCSFFDYTWYLFGSTPMIDIRLRTVAFLIVLIIVIKDFVKVIINSDEEKETTTTEQKKELVSVK